MTDLERFVSGALVLAVGVLIGLLLGIAVHLGGGERQGPSLQERTDLVYYQIAKLERIAKLHELALLDERP